MPSVKEMREQGAGLANKITELAGKINEESRDFSAVEKENWEQLNKDYDDLKGQIEIAERADTIRADQERTVGDPAVGRDLIPANPGAEDRADQPTDEDRALAIQAWCQIPTGEELNERQINACKKLEFNPNRRILRLALGTSDLLRNIQRKVRSSHAALDGLMDQIESRQYSPEMRALSAVTGTTGAFTIGPEFVNQLEVNMLAFGGMLQVAEIKRTSTGADLPWPTADDTTNTGEQIGESTAVSEAAPTFGQTIWKAYKFSSKMIKVPTELLEDSAFNLVSELGRMMGERLGRITNTRCTTGTGAATCKGLVTAATLGKTTASATAITPAEILALIHSVDPAYRISARFMFHDNVLLYLRQLVDSLGRPIWQASMEGGEPDRLYGYPYTVNQDMASSVASTYKTILFGQLNKYKIRQVRDMRVRRLDERYAEYDQVAFISYLRQDGNLLDAGTAPVKYMQQA